MSIGSCDASFWAFLGVAGFVQVCGDQFLERSQFSVRNKHRCERAPVFMANVQQLHSRALPHQGFECQFDIQETLELHLQAKTLFQSGGLLPRTSGVSMLRFGAVEHHCAGASLDPAL